MKYKNFTVECFGKVRIRTAGDHEFEFDIHEFVDVIACDALSLDTKIKKELDDILTDKYMFSRIIEINPQYKNPFEYEDN